MEHKVLKPLNPSTFEPLKEGWKWVRLGEVCEIIKGKNPKLFDECEDMDMLPYLTAEVIRYNAKPKWCKIDDKNSVIVHGDEIVIIIDGSNSGDVFIGCNGVLASTMGKLKLDKMPILKDYLYYFIKMNFVNLNKPKRGSAIPHLEKAIFYNLPIPLPPLETQRHIVRKLNEIMSEIEKARSACEKQLESAKALPAAYLREVFESDEAKKWERKRLREVFLFTQSGVWGDEPENLHDENVFPVLRSTEIDHRGRIVIEKEKLAFRKVQAEKANKYFVEPGDLLIVRSGGTTGKIILGRIGLYDGEKNKFLFSNFLLRAKVNLEITIPEYLWYYLNWEEFLEENIPQLMRRTTGIQNLPMDKYFAIQIPLPPLSTQRRIANYLKEKMAYVEKLRTSIEKQLEAINALPQAYLRKAFRGEL